MLVLEWLLWSFLWVLFMFVGTIFFGYCTMSLVYYTTRLRLLKEKNIRLGVGIALAIILCIYFG